MTTGFGPLYPANLSRCWLRGQFIDLAGRPMRGSVILTPSPSLLLDRVPKLIISGAPFKADLNADTGAFSMQVPVTDDPDVVPSGFTYAVTEPTGRKYNVVVPIDTPLLDSPGDPLHGQPVIDLIDIVPAPSPQPGTVQLISGAPGRGIDSLEVDVNGYLQVTYSDATTENAGYVGGSGGGTGGPRAYHHEQPVAAATWTVPHALGFNPAGITARDATGLIEPADVSYPDTSTCVLSWSAPVAGSVDLS